MPFRFISSAGAHTTLPNYAALGSPSYISRQFDSGGYLYRYVIRDVVSFNASVGYRFGAEARWWLRQTRVRLGVVNLADKAPPIASGQSTYSPSVNQSMVVGRTWTMELTKGF